MMEGSGMGHPFSRLDSGEKPSKIVWDEVPLRRMLGLFRGYVVKLALIIVLAGLSSIISLGPPLLLMQFIDEVLPNKDMQLFYLLSIAMIGLPLLSGLLGVWQGHMNNQVSEGVMRDLRDSLFTHLQRQSISFFTSSRSGEIVQRLLGDVQTVQDILTRLVVSGITQSLIVLSSLAILFYLDWKLALLSVFVLPIFIIPVRIVSRKRKRLRAQVLKERAEMSSQAGEIFGVSGALLTKLFNQESYQQQKFQKTNDKVMNLELRLNLIGRWFVMLVALLVPFGTAFVYFYGGWAIMNNTMTLGELVAFVACLTRLYGPLSQLMNLHVEVITATAIFQRIFEYLDLKPEVEDAIDARPLPNDINGSLSFDKVTFAYETGEERVVCALRDVSFEVPAGQMVALVGPSGAGKSTLLSLIPRLYDPQEGEIRIDGENIRQVTVHSLRQTMAMVTQETFLWHTTIRENLQFVKPDATDQEIIDACKQANIYELIQGLPQGLETVVGERGHRLSGGERQRLAIARAILANPQILLLDEATSHLDSESERAVQAALATLMVGRTTIVIAHRLSTILAADMIYVLDKGEIVERGSHQQLLDQVGLYATLYRTQFSERYPIV
jgi:ATP-binding cassette subfamily B protein